MIEQVLCMDMNKHNDRASIMQYAWVEKEHKQANL